LVDAVNWQASSRQYNHQCLSKRPSNCRRFDFSFRSIAITAVRARPDGRGRTDINGTACRMIVCRHRAGVAARTRGQSKAISGANVLTQQYTASAPDRFKRFWKD
jgi:hypothetical protein